MKILFYFPPRVLLFWGPKLRDIMLNIVGILYKNIVDIARGDTEAMKCKMNMAAVNTKYVYTYISSSAIGRPRYLLSLCRAQILFSRLCYRAHKFNDPQNYI